MLSRDFFRSDATILGKKLLGKILIRKIDGITIKAKIVETEAYMGKDDMASHNYGDKITDRNKIMYMDGGSLYIYQTYGIHFLMNIVSGEKNIGQAVLIRAVEIIQGLEKASFLRYKKPYNSLTAYQKKNFTNGPGKLTKALGIDKTMNGKDIFSKNLYIEEGSCNFETITDKRIGIDYAKQARDYPYRFYIKDNPCVSKIKPIDSLG